MKKFIAAVSLALVVVLGSVGLSACKIKSTKKTKTINKIDYTLVGKWQYDYIEDWDVIEIHQDGSGSMYMLGSNEMRYDLGTFSWKKMDDTNYIFVIDQKITTDAWYTVGQQISVTYNKNNDVISVVQSGGNIHTYYRVAE